MSARFKGCRIAGLTTNIMYSAMDKEKKVTLFEETDNSNIWKAEFILVLSVGKYDGHDACTLLESSYNRISQIPTQKSTTLDCFPREIFTK